MKTAFRKIRRLEAAGLREYALGLLSRRALSTNEVRQKLKERAEQAEDIEPLMERLRELGFLNDERFAEGFATARRSNDGHGSQRVLRDLRRRRVAPTVAEEAVKDAFAGSDEIQLIGQYLERRYRGKNLTVWLREEKNLASAFRRLRTAGFGASNAIKVLRQYSSRAEELEDEPVEIDESATAE